MRTAQAGWYTGARTQARPHQSIPISLLDRTGVLMSLWLLLLALTMACRAEVIERIAVIVGPGVITESEIVREIRLTAFLNGDPLDFSAASKRKTAERMVEQRLIHIENEASLYPPPTAE